MFFLILFIFICFYYFYIINFFILNHLYTCNGNSSQKKVVIHAVYNVLMSLANKDHESWANQ